MDPHETVEKEKDELAAVATRAVAFGPSDRAEDVEEKAPHAHAHAPRPKGVEMKREMTKEDKELADAGYEHLRQEKAQAHKGAGEGEGEPDGVDIQEHRLAFEELQGALDTAFDAKDPALSPGLSGDEAKARLARDGPNVLTPPKKKSALRKVRCRYLLLGLLPLAVILTVV